METPDWILELQTEGNVVFFRTNEGSVIGAVIRKEWANSYAYCFTNGQMTGGTCEDGGDGRNFLLQVLGNWGLPGGQVIACSEVLNNTLEMFKNFLY